MTHMLVFNPTKGHCERILRDDAVSHQGRHVVPTTDRTVWVSTWEEYKAAGGTCCYNEDQTEIELLLPAPFKFSIQFMGKGR